MNKTIQAPMNMEVMKKYGIAIKVKHRERYGTIVKSYEFDKTKITHLEDMIPDVIKDCKKKIFAHIGRQIYL